MDVILEKYNCDDYPELDGEVRVATGLDDAVLGIDAISLRLIYSYKKAIEILNAKFGVGYAESNSAVIDLEEIIRDLSPHQYSPIWLRFEGSFDKVFKYSNDKYEVLRDKLRCADNLEDAVIGFDEESLRMVYSQSGCIKALMKNDSMSYEDAKEFLDFNTFGYSDIKEYQPIWCDDEDIFMLEDIEL